MCGLIAIKPLVAARISIDSRLTARGLLGRPMAASVLYLKTSLILVASRVAAAAIISDQAAGPSPAPLLCASNGTMQASTCRRLGGVWRRLDGNRPDAMTRAISGSEINAGGNNQATAGLAWRNGDGRRLVSALVGLVPKAWAGRAPRRARPGSSVPARRLVIQ